MPHPADFLERSFRRLARLEPTTPLRLDRRALAVITAFHLLALLACIPYLFTWSGMAIAIAGLYLFGTLGVNIGFHRLLVHRGFVCPKWLERTLAVLGTCCLQGTPIGWVAVHRKHHQHSDDAGDPHTPRDGFFWSHVGWTLVHDPALYTLTTYDRYARDLITDRFYKNLERAWVWRRLQLAQWGTFLVIGALFGGFGGRTGAIFDLAGALQGSLSWLVWGVFVRTVAVWHITWSVNSLTHVWGYRNYATDDDSRNNWLVGLVGMGEGWHNNHHSDPRSVMNGHRWWELDISYITVRTLAFFGLAWDLILPRRARAFEPAADPQAERTERRAA
jgi:stearoyl-CoA desaturase (delta-9 desaturase)